MLKNNPINQNTKPTNQKSSLLIWFGIFLVILGFLGGYFVFRQGPNPTPTQIESTVNQTEQPTSTQGPTDVKAVIITYKNGVFTPNTINIKKGTTVKFVNEDTDQMWVASSPHPQHTDLPDFDQLKGVGQGVSYEYTFTKVGNWKFHNHLKPTAFGTVIVK